MITAATPYMEQTPPVSLHEIADRLWLRGEYECYRALLAYIKERDNLIKEAKHMNTS